MIQIRSRAGLKHLANPITCSLTQDMRHKQPVELAAACAVGLDGLRGQHDSAMRWRVVRGCNAVRHGRHLARAGGGKARRRSAAFAEDNGGQRDPHAGETGAVGGTGQMRKTLCRREETPVERPPENSDVSWVLIVCALLGARAPRFPTPIPVLTVSGSAGAKTITFKLLSVSFMLKKSDSILPLFHDLEI